MKTNKVSKLLMLVLALAMCLSTVTAFAEDTATENTALPFADDFSWATLEDKGVSTTEGAEYTFDQLKADTHAVQEGNIVGSVLEIEDDPSTEEDDSQTLTIVNEDWAVTGTPKAAWASAGTLKLRPRAGGFSAINFVKDVGELSAYTFKVSAARTTKYQGSWDIDTGVRFSVSADGKSYYELRSNWARNMKFVKVVDGKEDATTVQTTTGFSSGPDHYITMDVKVYGNLITWKCTDGGTTIFESSFVDPAPLTPSIPVQLIGRNGDGGTCLFDNFSIDELDALPELPIYDDFAWATLTDGQDATDETEAVESTAVKVNTAGAYVVGSVDENGANVENDNWQLSTVHTPGNNSGAWATDGSIKLRGKDGTAYTNLNYAKMVGNLNSAYNVKAEAARTQLSDYWYDTSMGIRVAIGNNEKDFYQIISDRKSSCKIRFSKFVDGAEIAESVAVSDVAFGWQGNKVAFDVTVDNGTVYWTAIRPDDNLVFANGVYVDPAPIAITPATIPVALVMSNSNAYTTFDNVAITNVKTATLPYVEDFANATLTSAGSATVYTDTYAALTPNKKLVAAVDENGNKIYNDDFVTSATAWRTDDKYGARAFLMNGELYVRGAAGYGTGLVNMAKKIDGLSSEYKIEVNQRLNPSAIGGNWDGTGRIRFATTADEKTYYEMYRAGRKIQFSHIVNGTEVYKTELAGLSGSPDHKLTYKLSVEADKITWDVHSVTTNEAITSGSYTGSEEYPLHTFNPATDIPVQIGGNHEGLAGIYDDLKIDNIKKLPINDDFSWAASDSSTAVTTSAGTVVSGTDVLGNKFYNMDYSLAENRGSLYAEGGKLTLAPNGGWYDGVASGWDYRKTLVNVNPVTNLTDEHSINVTLNRVNINNYDFGMGIRFAISADKNSYCQLQVQNNSRNVKFYVVKDGATVYETEPEGAVSNPLHEINFAVTYRKGAVEYTVKDLRENVVLTTGTYTDASPVAITAASIPMQFYGNNNGMTVSMDNLVIENLEPLATGSIEVQDLDAMYFVNVTNPDFYGITDGSKFVYAYYAGGSLIECVVADVDMSYLDENNVLSNIVMKNTTAGATGKVFFWKDLDDIAPLTPVIPLVAGIVD